MSKNSCRVALLLLVTGAHAFRSPRPFKVVTRGLLPATGVSPDSSADLPPELPRPEVLRVLKEAIEENIAAEQTALAADQHHHAKSRNITSFKAKPTRSSPRSVNEKGQFYVSEGCINCGTCRWIAPETFAARGFKSAVVDQPVASYASHRVEDTPTTSPLRKAVQAMVTCPSGSIRTTEPLGPLVRRVIEEDFPRDIDPERLPGVYHLGFHRHGTIGAAAYLLVRRSGGAKLGEHLNIMVDVPRYNRRLADSIERRFGGIDYLILTSRGLEEGHAQWKARFPNLVRVMHRHDLKTGDTLSTVEEVLDGSGPWDLTLDDDGDDDTAASASDVRILHTPGRTFGALSVWFQPQLPLAHLDNDVKDREFEKEGEKEDGRDGWEPSAAVAVSPQFDAVMLAGGHLGFDSKRERLEGFSGMNRAGLERQAASIRALVARTSSGDERASRSGDKDPRPWQWLLSSYGKPVRFSDEQELHRSIDDVASRLESGRRTLI